MWPAALGALAELELDLLSFPLAWTARGWLDRLAGGVGLRRGRRDQHELRVDEALDWWRVEELREEPDDRLLRLRAEMKVPGVAWLELRVQLRAGGGVEYRQRAVFIPHGLLGHLYWWVVAPFHDLVCPGGWSVSGRRRCGFTCVVSTVVLR